VTRLDSPKTPADGHRPGGGPASWARFVVAYLGGLALGLALDWTFAGQVAGEPLRGRWMLFFAALGAVNAGLFGYRPPEPVLSRRVVSVVAGTAALGLIAAAAVGGTIGWRWGTARACGMALFVSLLQPTVFIALARRRASAAALLASER
jgi:hypothetical protein